jgi:uncharacterized repeat protein (TIGR03847 family)
MPEHYDFDLNPASFITIGTEGPPGERTFFLQASEPGATVSLIIEKEHAIALAASIERLLADVDDASTPDDPPDPDTMALVRPAEAVFRVTEMGLGLDEGRGLVILVAREGSEDDPDPGQSARFAASYEQMHALARHTLSVVKQGRPICPLCGNPIDADGHFCPRSNGHIQADD